MASILVTSLMTAANPSNPDLTIREGFSGALGSISLACWIFLLLPQLIENYRNGSAEAISLAFIFVWFLGDVCNLAGALWAGLVPTVVAIAVYFCIADGVLIGQCLYYQIKNKRKQGRNILRAESVTEAAAAEDSPLLGRRRTESLTIPGSGERRRSSANSRRRSSISRDDPLAKILEEADETGARLWIKNIFSILAIILVGSCGWAMAYESGVWKPSSKKLVGDQEPMAAGALILGYLSAIAYLGARIPQIIKNAREKSCEGLSLLFFILSVLGNATYGAGILCHSTEKDYFLTNLPWLIGSLGTMVEDAIIFVQFHIYSRPAGESAIECSLLPQSHFPSDATCFAEITMRVYQNIQHWGLDSADSSGRQFDQTTQNMWSNSMKIMSQAITIETLPDEVLTQIPLTDTKTLRALVQVSKRFNRVFSSRLYRSFTYYSTFLPSVVTGPDGSFLRHLETDKEIQKLHCFVRTIYTTPALADHVRELRLTGKWLSDILDEYVPDVYNDTLHDVRSVVEKNQSWVLMVPRLSKLERIDIDMGILEPLPRWPVMKSRLKSIKLTQSYDFPPALIVTLLSIPTLKYLSLHSKSWNIFPEGPLSQIPARSSSVERLHLAQVGDNDHGNNLHAPKFHTICGKVKVLKELHVQLPTNAECFATVHTHCASIHAEVVEEAIFPHRSTLEVLTLEVNSMAEVGNPYRRFQELHLFRALRTLTLYPEFILEEPGDLDVFKSTFTVGQALGFFAMKLPPSLVKLVLFAETNRLDRGHTFWRDLVSDLVHSRTHLPSVKSIKIEARPFDDENCMRCAENERPTVGVDGYCDLCYESDLSQQMVEMCKEAGIALEGPWIKHPTMAITWLTE